MAQQGIDQKAVLATLDRIIETELAGVVRYTHYSFMVFGYNHAGGICPFADRRRRAALG
jgi:bacterioferritin (cytochrome b1)